MKDGTVLHIFRASGPVICAFFMLSLGSFWALGLLGERDYSFFLLSLVTKRASQSWVTLGEVARREQEGVRLVSAGVTSKAGGYGGGLAGTWMLGLHPWSGWGGG